MTAPKPCAPRSLLVVRPGALGDALLTLPLLDALARAGVGRVTLLGTPASWRFLAPSAPNGSPIELADLGGRDWLGLFGGGAGLGKAAAALLVQCDAGLVCLGRERAAVEAALRAGGIERLAGARPAALGEATDAPPSETVFRIEPAAPASEHAARRLLAALPGLGLACDEDALWRPRPLTEDRLLRITEDEKATLRARLGLAPAERLLVIHPGSGGAAKCWPAERFAALAAAGAARPGLRPVILLGPSEAAAGRAMLRALPSASRFAVMANRPLREVLALLSIAEVYVGNDSGISHLAARATATLVLFGPSDPLIWRPLGSRVAVLRAAYGRLAELAVDSVLAALLALIRA
jgi:heptosyltransferase III